MEHEKHRITINQITISIFETIWAIGITVASSCIQLKRERIINIRMTYETI